MLWISCVFLVVAGVWWYANQSSQSVQPKKHTKSDPTLSKSEREYLWAIEHHGNIIAQIGLKRLRDALRDGDKKALATIFDDTFHGSVLSKGETITVPPNCVTVTLFDKDNSTARIADRAQFVSHLLAHHKIFSKPPQIKTSLMTLSPPQIRNPRRRALGAVVIFCSWKILAKKKS